MRFNVNWIGSYKMILSNVNLLDAARRPQKDNL